MRLPTSGAAWKRIKAIAEEDESKYKGKNCLCDQDSEYPQAVLAKAYVAVRTNNNTRRQEVVNYLKDIVLTENQRDTSKPEKYARSLAVGRNLAAYVIAADLIGYRPGSGYDGADRFYQWLSKGLDTDERQKDNPKGIVHKINGQGKSLASCHNERPNNWGTMCGASRIAVDLFINDTDDLAEAINTYKGFIGEVSYNGWESGYDDSANRAWTCDRFGSNLGPPMNPSNCWVQGHNVSGAVIDDVTRENDKFKWPPNKTFYAWGGYSALAAQAEMLYRAGYRDQEGHHAYDWGDQAIKRGMEFLRDAMPSSQSAPTDWVSWLVNYRYGGKLLEKDKGYRDPDSDPDSEGTILLKSPVGNGRLMDFTDWTHNPAYR